MPKSIRTFTKRRSLCDVSTLQGAEHWKAPAEAPDAKHWGLTSQGQPGSTKSLPPSLSTPTDERRLRAEHQENIVCTVPDPALSRHPSTPTPLLGTVDRDDAQTDELQPIPAFPPVCGGSVTPHWRPP
uniref:Uncharacterized protein n=1 Tax=Coccidioides posadasii RMSCC 3488 TaxID=454284 RepID=A0A0J6FNH6_COCPO|nr:hypothetical protein CPAG_07292 [Coccidioides posadasii RMSCC 3488]